MKTEKACFAAGCFWGVEELFFRLPGVTETAVGYTHGDSLNPTYREVCSGMTGHVEAVELSFDPNQISFEKLLEAFWTCHDPTQVGGQGPDMGSQYRSGVYFYSPEQEVIALTSKKEKSSYFKKSITTEILAAKTFYMAEEYHQKYIQKNSGANCSHF